MKTIYCDLSLINILLCIIINCGKIRLCVLGYYDGANYSSYSTG